MLTNKIKCKYKLRNSLKVVLTTNSYKNYATTIDKAIISYNSCCFLLEANNNSRHQAKLLITNHLLLLQTNTHV